MPAEIFVEGDARLAAAALADELERRGHSAVGYRTDHVREQIAEAAKPPTIHDAGRPGALDPRLVMIRLNELLPAERNVILDNGHHEAFSTAHLNVPDPSAFQSPLEFHCVGASTGMAIGAAYARPDRLTVYCVGDLGMLMTMGDFESIARLGLPILVVVINDSALGAEVQYLQVLGLPDDIARESTPSFAAVAQGMGYEAYTIERLEDLDVLVGKLDKLEGPLLLDVPVTTDVRANWLEEVMLSHTAEPAAA